MVGEGKAEGYPCPFSAWCVGLCGGSGRCGENQGVETNHPVHFRGRGQCRDALDQAEHTRAMLCEVLIGARVLPDEWKEEHLPVRVITDCKSLFDCGAKDASVPEDRGTALTVASLRERCSAGVGRDTKRSGLLWVPTRVQLADGLTKSSAEVFLRNASTSRTAQLHEDSTKVLTRTQLTVREKFETSQLPKWILSRKIGGSEHTTQESPAQDPSLRTFFHSLTTCNFLLPFHSQLATSLLVSGDACT